jgi:transglutaminase-like putative cysteine protease
MRVAFSHVTRFDYNGPVVDGVMDVRLGPHSDDDQHWEDFSIAVSPAAAVRRYTDGFDNAAHLITLSGPHAFVEVVTRGEVRTLLEDPFAPPARPPRPLSAAERFDALAASAMVPRDPALEAMAAPFRPADPEATFDALRRLSHLVHEELTYQKQVTTVATTCVDALRQRAGVCQDFAHVLIGLCRAIGVPARYVSGYTAHGGPSGSRKTSQSATHGPVREDNREPGASHAWAEAWTPTHGWRGFDPTNDLVASAHHVKVAIGRDYADVAPTRGTYRGAAEERLSVDVSTRILD